MVTSTPTARTRTIHHQPIWVGADDSSDDVGGEDDFEDDENGDGSMLKGGGVVDISIEIHLH